MTPDVLQAPHRQDVTEQLQQPGTYLLVEDTTQLRWSYSTRPRPGLGPVAATKNAEQGVLLHSLVAARWPGSPDSLSAPRPAVALLGLLDQQYYVRQPVPAAERAHPHGGSRPRQGRPRESGLWTQSLRHVGTPPPGSRWVVVADRGADIYEHLLTCQQHGLGFVVRACQDRGLVSTHQSVFTVARSQPSAGQFRLPIRSRPDRPTRRVTLQVSFSPLLALRAPQRPGASTGKGQPVAVSVVRVWEADSDLEWLLLCDGVVDSFIQARERAWQYATRWLIEDFHKALKTGLGAERLQLHTAIACSRR
ncbi:IS4 family transposase [Hymenobacter sediminis]|uniref:IS4 family transposase n=1 Tax=Hymenobacter sediminis TaxID=2218621 RepID=UPI0021D36C40|nr:IS4 family transposase [Hymenobacter sediminis]